jgi:uncharacterized membrane protein (DUF485 family)
MTTSHSPGPAPSHERPEVVSYNSRLGLWLFLLYVILYAGFVALSAFKPAVMGTDVAGVNLAIVYGIGLIIAAFVLAIIYMLLCRKHDEAPVANAADAEGRT